MPGFLQAKLCPILYGSVSVVGGENLHKITSILIYMLLLVCNVFLQLIQLLNFNFHQVINKEVFFLHFDRYFRVLDSLLFSCYYCSFEFQGPNHQMFICYFFWPFWLQKTRLFFCNLVFDEHTAMKSYTKMYMYTNSGQFFFFGNI